MQQPQLIQPFVPGIAFHRNRDTAPAYWMLDLKREAEEDWGR